MARKKKAGPNALQLIDELPAILGYGLQRDALLTIVLFAVLRLVASYLPFVAGLILNLIMVVGVLKYAGEVLLSSANGRDEAPNGLSVSDEVGWTLLRVQGALVLTAFALAVVLGNVGMGNLAFLVYLALALAVPAAMASAAIDQDTLHALNPLLWVQTALRIGGGYLAASLLCVLIGIAEGAVAGWRIPGIPSLVQIFVGLLVSHFAIVCVFRMIGRMVYVYRDALHYDVEAPTILARPPDRDQSILDEGAQLVLRGDKLAASKLLGAHIQEKGGSDAVHQRYRQLLAELGDQAALTQHSRSYLNVLIANERWPDALDFWTECRKQDAGLWPSDPAQVLELAEQAFKRSRPELTLLFGNGMHVAYPKHEAVAQVYFLVARTMAETQQRRAEARNLLDATLASYPRTKKRAEIEAYLGAL